MIDETLPQQQQHQSRYWPARQKSDIIVYKILETLQILKVGAMRLQLSFSFLAEGPLIVVIFNFSEMKDSLKRGQIKLINSTKNAADFSFIFLVPFYFLINPMPCFSSAAAAGEDQETGNSCDLIWKVPRQP